MLENHISQHIITVQFNIEQALKELNKLGKDSILFVIDKNFKLIGSITDGDIRRGLLNGITLNMSVENVMHMNPKYIFYDSLDIKAIIDYRNSNYRIIPILNDKREIIDLINFNLYRSFLPLDVVIMAGGRGIRLSPLTDNIPKPMLKIGHKPIIEYSIDRLIKFGIINFWISIKYLGEQIEDYFGTGNRKGVNVKYIKENIPLGTVGAIANVHDFKNNSILITNSDLLSDIDYEEFYLDFIESNADMAIASFPYKVDIPYAVLELHEDFVHSFKEKPSYTFYSNGGIYIVKKEVLSLIPKNQFYNMTDLMENMIKNGYKIKSFPLSGYWLDIGSHQDFERANKDIYSVKFNY